DLIFDGTDNVETRYLLNDVSVKHRIPWIYGACVGTEGRVMAMRPPETACLRCVFSMPPGRGELPTCDTAGVLAAAAAIVASLQCIAAIKILTEQFDPETSALLSLNVWDGAFRSTSLADARDLNCPCCARREFTYLARPDGG